MTDATPTEIADAMRKAALDRRRPRVLALDLATQSGWALGRPGDDRPQSGTVRLAGKGASQDAIFGGALRWLIPFTKDYEFDQLVIEQAVRKQQWKSSTDADDITRGLIAIARGVVFERGIYRPTFAPVNSVRQFFLGDGRLERDEAKHRTMQRCAALGWDVADDNEADALAIWAWRCAIIDPTAGIAMSPLFDKRRRA
jgi:Holliday junction resolvasome RuvABC endonuclease subunit